MNEIYVPAEISFELSTLLYCFLPDLITWLYFTLDAYYGTSKSYQTKFKAMGKDTHFHFSMLIVTKLTYFSYIF